MTDKESKHLQSIDQTLKDLSQTLLLMWNEIKGNKTATVDPSFKPQPVVTKDIDSHYEFGQRWFNLDKELEARDINIGFLDQFERMLQMDNYSPIDYGWITRNGVKLVSEGYLELLDGTTSEDLQTFFESRQTHSRG